MGFFYDPVKEQKKRQQTKRPPVSQSSHAVFDCSKCRLYQGINSPKMPMHGKGKTGIFVVAQSPGKEEDKEGRQLIGDSGQLIRAASADVGFDFDEDFYVQNAFRCHPKTKKQSWMMEIKCCHDLLMKDIDSVKPWLVVACGKEAIQSVLGEFGADITVGAYQSLCIPMVEKNYWLYCTNHPAALLHGGGGSSKYDLVFRQDWKRIRELYEQHLVRPRPAERMKLYWDLDNVNVVTDFNEACSLLDHLNMVSAFFHDYENYPLKPYHNEAEALCFAASYLDDDDKIKVFCISLKKGSKWAPWSPSQRRRIIAKWKTAQENTDVVKYAHNIKHELQWSWHLGIVPKGRLECTQTKAHLLREPKKTTGLKFQVFTRWGCKYDVLDEFKEDMRLAPEPDIYEYCCHDARFGMQLYLAQEKEKYETFDTASEILRDGNYVLARAEATGLRVDLELAKEIGDGFGDEKTELETWLLEHEWHKKWLEKKNRPVNLNSHEQIGELLFDIVGLKGGTKLESGKWATDQTNLKPFTYDNEWIRKWQMYGKLGRAKGTFVDGHIFGNLWHDNLLHCSYRLDWAETYRSSCRDPNLQNIIKRDKRGRVLRKAFVPLHPDWEMAEFDYDQHEVVVSCHYTQDKKMIDAVLTGHDFHREYAAKLLKKPEKRVSNTARSMAGKNGFVFPILYGAFPKTIFEGLGKNGYKVPFYHVKKVWNEFRKEYSDTSEWQEQQIEFFNQNGYIETMLGFRRRAPLSANEIINFPIQSTAFHYLLRSIYVADQEFQKRGMRAQFLKQVHDSSEFHYPKEERNEVFEIVGERFRDLPWDFAQNPPVNISGKAGPNWHDLKKVDV